LPRPAMAEGTVAAWAASPTNGLPRPGRPSSLTCGLQSTHSVGPQGAGDDARNGLKQFVVPTEQGPVTPLLVAEDLALRTWPVRPDLRPENGPGSCRGPGYLSATAAHLSEILIGAPAEGARTAGSGRSCEFPKSGEGQTAQFATALTDGGMQGPGGQSCPPARYAPLPPFRPTPGAAPCRGVHPP
jgi:hypothetical protein